VRMNSLSVEVLPDAPRPSNSTSDSKSRQFHGSLMVAAWAYLAPIAFVIKRFGTGRIGVQVGGTPLPLVLHIVLMLLVVVLTIVGAVYALAEFGTGIIDHSSPHGHGELGIVVLCLAVLQTVLAFAGRCFNQVKNFQVIHIFGALVLFGLAVAQIFSGTQLYEDRFGSQWARDLRTAAAVGLCVLLSPVFIFSIPTRDDGLTSPTTAVEVVESDKQKKYGVEQSALDSPRSLEPTKSKVELEG